jgi:hypothetical protein
MWWSLSSATIGLLSVAVLSSEGWDHKWAISAILWFFLSAIGPALLALAIGEVSKLRALVTDISADPLNFSVGARGLAICGIAVLGLAVATTVSVDIFPFIGWAQVAAFVIVCTFFLSYGALIYVYGATFMLAVRLLKVRVRAEVFSWPRDSVRAIHSIYMRLLLVGATAYLLGVAVVRLTPWSRSLLDLTQPWIGLWVLPPGLAAIAFFASFNIALHNVLLRCRGRAEREITENLQLVYDSWKTNRERSAEGSISELLKWRESIRLERLWPMDLKAGVVTVVTLLIPTIDAVLRWAGVVSK